MFEKITDNVEIHQTLPDTPNMTTQELKTTWDKGCKIIKEAFNNLIDNLIDSKIARTSLYKNETGTTSDITLSDSISNYSEYEIKYLGQHGEPYSTGKLSTSYIDRIHLTGVFLGVKDGTADGALKVSNARVSISDNVLTFVSNRWYEKPYNSGASNGTYQDASNIKIVEVVGYK